MFCDSLKRTLASFQALCARSTSRKARADRRTKTQKTNRAPGQPIDAIHQNSAVAASVPIKRHRAAFGFLVKSSCCIKFTPANRHKGPYRHFRRAGEVYRGRPLKRIQPPGNGQHGHKSNGPPVWLGVGRLHRWRSLAYQLVPRFLLITLLPCFREWQPEQRSFG